MMERCAVAAGLRAPARGARHRGLRGLHQARGAAAEGARCAVTARLDEVVDGRKLRFAVEVTEGERTIGVGTHERRMVDRSAFGG